MKELFSVFGEIKTLIFSCLIFRVSRLKLLKQDIALSITILTTVNYPQMVKDYYAIQI